MIIKREILMKEDTKQFEAFGFAPVMDPFNFMDQIRVVWQTNFIFVKIQDTVQGIDRFSTGALYMYLCAQVLYACICGHQCSIHVSVCPNAKDTCISMPQCSVSPLCSIHLPVCPSALCIYESLCAPVLYTNICVPQCSKHVPLCSSALYIRISVCHKCSIHVSVHPSALNMYLCAQVLHTCTCVPLCPIHVPVCPCALYMYLCAPLRYTCMCAPVLYTCTCVPQCSEHVPVCPCALYKCALEPRNGPISPLYFYPFCMPFYGTRDSRLSHCSPLLYLSSLSVYLSLFLSLNFSIYSPHSLPFPTHNLYIFFPLFLYLFLFNFATKNQYSTNAN